MILRNVARRFVTILNYFMFFHVGGTTAAMMLLLTPASLGYPRRRILAWDTFVAGVSNVFASFFILLSLSTDSSTKRIIVSHKKRVSYEEDLISYVSVLHAYILLLSLEFFKDSLCYAKSLNSCIH